MDIKIDETINPYWGRVVKQRDLILLALWHLQMHGDKAACLRVLEMVPSYPELPTHFEVKEKYGA